MQSEIFLRQFGTWELKGSRRLPIGQEDEAGREARVFLVTDPNYSPGAGKLEAMKKICRWRLWWGVGTLPDSGGFLNEQEEKPLSESRDLVRKS